MASVTLPGHLAGCCLSCVAAADACWLVTAAASGAAVSGAGETGGGALPNVPPSSSLRSSLAAAASCAAACAASASSLCIRATGKQFKRRAMQGRGVGLVHALLNNFQHHQNIVIQACFGRSCTLIVEWRTETARIQQAMTPTKTAEMIGRAAWIEPVTSSSACGRAGHPMVTCTRLSNPPRPICEDSSVQFCAQQRRSSRSASRTLPAALHQPDSASVKRCCHWFCKSCHQQR